MYMFYDGSNRRTKKKTCMHKENMDNKQNPHRKCYRSLETTYKETIIGRTSLEAFIFFFSLAHDPSDNMYGMGFWTIKPQLVICIPQF